MWIFQAMLSGFREEVRLAKLLLPEAGTGINSVPGSCSGFDEEDGFWVRKQLENNSSASPSSSALSCTQNFIALHSSPHWDLYFFMRALPCKNFFQAIGVEYIYFRLVWQEEKQLKVFAELCWTLWPVHSSLLEWRRNFQSVDMKGCQLIWEGGFGRGGEGKKEHLAKFLVLEEKMRKYKHIEHSKPPMPFTNSTLKRKRHLVEVQRMRQRQPLEKLTAFYFFKLCSKNNFNILFFTHGVRLSVQKPAHFSQHSWWEEGRNSRRGIPGWQGALEGGVELVSSRKKWNSGCGEWPAQNPQRNASFGRGLDRLEWSQGSSLLEKATGIWPGAEIHLSCSLGCWQKSNSCSSPRNEKVKSDRFHKKTFPPSHWIYPLSQSLFLSHFFSS